MESLQTLLDEVRLIVNRNRIEREEKRKRGELFNIFNVLDLRTNEVRTHSAFIAELLNPDGNHGLGDRFLQAFLGSVPELKEWHFDTQKAVVTVEDASAGTINEETSEGGRMDITIRSHDRSQIIILENKIYAGDQPKQLVRYANYAKRFKESAIIYLTLYRQEASEASCVDDAGNRVPYIPIGYNDEILTWLGRCQQIAVQHPIIRETILQYINLIKELTHQMENDKNKQALLEAMTRNIDATATIYTVPQTEYIAYLLQNFVFPRLQTVADELGLKFGYTSNLLSGVKNSSLYFFNPQWHRAGIMFSTETSNFREFYWGISYYEGNEKLHVPEPFKLNCMTSSPTAYWPYGWARLDKYKDWDSSAMPDMVNGQFAGYIKQKLETMLRELKERGISL